MCPENGILGQSCIGPGSFHSLLSRRAWQAQQVMPASLTIFKDITTRFLSLESSRRSRFQFVIDFLSPSHGPKKPVLGKIGILH